MIQLPNFSIKQAVAAGVLLIGSAVAAYALTPALSDAGKPDDLEALVPHQIGEWREQPNPYTQVGLVAGDDKSVEQPYDRILMRSYRNAQGTDVMLALAYAREQTQDIKIHRPEVCYKAQGFVINQRQETSFAPLNQATPDPRIKLVRMLVTAPNRTEVVSYWIRIGDEFPITPLGMRMKILRDGLAGTRDDGILVRASTIVDDPSQVENAYRTQERFLAELVSATSAQAPDLLIPPLKNPT